MYLSKKEKIYLGKILKIFYKKKTEDEKKIFSETVFGNFLSEDVLGIEIARNEERLLDFSKFYDLVTERSAIPKEFQKSVKNDVLSLIKNKHVDFIIRDSFYKKRSNSNIFSFFKKPLGYTQHIESKKDVQIIKDGVLASVEQELINTYLESRAKNFLAIDLHILIKAIVNIETPKEDSLIPKELYQKTGMIQLGLSLNNMSKINLEKNYIDLDKKDAYLIKSLARTASQHSSIFENSKLSEIRWRHANLRKIELIEKRKK